MGQSSPSSLFGTGSLPFATISTRAAGWRAARHFLVSILLLWVGTQRLQEHALRVLGIQTRVLDCGPHGLPIGQSCQLLVILSD